MYLEEIVKLNIVFDIFLDLKKQVMHQDFKSAGAGASWRALGVKTAGAHSTRSLKIQRVQKVMFQRSAGSSNRCTRANTANTFPENLSHRNRNSCKSAESCFEKLIKSHQFNLFCGGIYLFGTTVCPPKPAGQIFNRLTVAKPPIESPSRGNCYHPKPPPPSCLFLLPF